MTVLLHGCFILLLNKNISTSIIFNWTDPPWRAIHMLERQDCYGKVDNLILGLDQKAVSSRCVFKALNLNSELYRCIWVQPPALIRRMTHCEATGEKPPPVLGLRTDDATQTRCLVSLQTDRAVQAKLICILQEKALDRVVYPAADNAFDNN